MKNLLAAKRWTIQIDSTTTPIKIYIVILIFYISAHAQYNAPTQVHGFVFLVHVEYES